MDVFLAHQEELNGSNKLLTQLLAEQRHCELRWLDFL